MRSLVVFALLLAARAGADDELPVVQAFRGIDAIESANVVRYGRKGPQPYLDHASINFAVRDGKPHTVGVKKLEIISNNCHKPAKSDIKAYPVKMHELFTWDGDKPLARGRPSVKIPKRKAQRYSVKASFAVLTTTTACAFAIDLVVDGARKRIQLPLSFKSLDPIGK